MAQRRVRRRGRRGSGSIEQLANGRWRLKVSHDGRKVTYGTYATEDEAATAQARWKLTGLLPADDPQVEMPASVAVGGVRSDEWFERWQGAKRARSSIVRAGRRRGGAESTAARDRAQWRAWWSDSIGERLPHTLRAEDLTSVIAAMEEAGRAPNYIRTHWVMVTSLFNWLVEEEVLAASPIAKVSVGVDPVEDRVREIVVPDFRFIEMLSNRLQGEDRLVFELLLGTGGRRSEVAGIRIGDVDLPAKRVWIREPIVEVEGKLVRRRKPKGGHYRAIVVGPQLAQLLREQLLRRGMPDPDEPLILSHRDAGLRWNNYLKRTFRPAVESTAVRWAAVERKRLVTEEGLSKAEARMRAVKEADRLKKLTPHHLRHTAAALLWAAGASDIEVQLTLGHRDVETSKRLYAHLLSGAQESSAARVEQLRRARPSN